MSETGAHDKMIARGSLLAVEVALMEREAKALREYVDALQRVVDANRARKEEPSEYIA